MVRHLLIPALLAVLFAPDWATAFDPCACPPPVIVSPYPPPGGVILRGPIVYGPVVNCQPTTGTVLPEKGPTIVPERGEQPKKPQIATEPPKTMPAKAEEIVDPKPGTLPIIKQEESKPLTPKPIEQKPIESKPIEPKSEVKQEKPIEPKPEVKQVVPPSGHERIPVPSVPPMPPMPPSKPDMGKMEFDIPPIGDVPPAKPQPAEDPKTPAAKPADAPKAPEKLPDFNFDDLPKVSGGMAQPVEANKKTVANSSPLSDKVAEVDVFPRDGKSVTTAKRGVTFVNKSARDILLTVDGQTVRLPSKTVLAAELPVAFKWQIGGEPERSEKVPDGSPGIDVVIRK